MLGVWGQALECMCVICNYLVVSKVNVLLTFHRQLSSGVSIAVSQVVILACCGILIYLHVESECHRKECDWRMSHKRTPVEIHYLDTWTVSKHCGTVYFRL